MTTNKSSDSKIAEYKLVFDLYISLYTLYINLPDRVSFDSSVGHRLRDKMIEAEEKKEIIMKKILYSEETNGKY